MSSVTSIASPLPLSGHADGLLASRPSSSRSMRLRLPPGRCALLPFHQSRREAHEPNRPPSPFRHRRRRRVAAAAHPRGGGRRRNGSRRAGDSLADPVQTRRPALHSSTVAACLPAGWSRQRLPAHPRVSADATSPAASPGCATIHAPRPIAICPLGARSSPRAISSPSIPAELRPALNHARSWSTAPSEPGFNGREPVRQS